MHIITLDQEPSSKRGGQERSLFDVLKGLRELGHSIELGYVHEGDLLEQYQEMGVRTVRIDRVNIFNKLSIKQYKEFLSSSNAFSKEKDSVIYINQLKDAPLAVWMKAQRHTNVVCHVRLPPLGKSAQIRMALPFIDHFIVANQHMYNLHTKSGIPGEKIVVIPNGFWMDSINTVSRKENLVFSIAYVGRLDETKGVHVIVEAARLLKLQGVNFKVDIAGKPMDKGQEQYLEELKEKVRREGLASEVSFIGHIQNPVEHLSNYDLCLFPSLWEEPFGRVIVESILAGTPVIGHDIGSVSEILDDPKKEWVYKSIEEMVQKILVLRSNPASYQLKKRQAFVRQQYDLKNIIFRIESILKQNSKPNLKVAKGKPMPFTVK